MPPNRMSITDHRSTNLTSPSLSASSSLHIFVLFLWSSTFKTYRTKFFLFICETHIALGDFEIYRVSLRCTWCWRENVFRWPRRRVSVRWKKRSFERPTVPLPADEHVTAELSRWTPTYTDFLWDEIVWNSYGMSTLMNEMAHSRLCWQ